MFPPMLLYLRIAAPDRQGFGIWLPLFLVWLILLPVVVLVLVVTMLVDVVLILAGQSYHHYTELLFACFGVLGATRGTVVHIDSEENVVDLDFV
jgi:hypothetical protein